MKLLRKIYKRVKPFFTGYGFSMKGGCFYKIKDDIAFCVSFERPSDLVYVSFYIIPLYMNAKEHYLTYGNRINSVYHNKLPQITASSTEQDIDDWCDILRTVLDEDIFCYFEKISSPRALLSFLNQNPQKVSTYLFCGDWNVARLRVFTILYLHEYSKMAAEIERYQLALCNAPLVERLKIEMEEEIRLLEDISSRGDYYVNEYIRQISRKTISACFDYDDGNTAVHSGGV